MSRAKRSSRKERTETGTTLNSLRVRKIAPSSQNLAFPNHREGVTVQIYGLIQLITAKSSRLRRTLNKEGKHLFRNRSWNKWSQRVDGQETTQLKISHLKDQVQASKTHLKGPLQRKLNRRYRWNHPFYNLCYRTRKLNGGTKRSGALLTTTKTQGKVTPQPIWQSTLMVLLIRISFIKYSKWNLKNRLPSNSKT